MVEKTEQTPEWIDKILNYVIEKPYKYHDLIEGSFGVRSLGKDSVEGFGFKLGFLFSEAICPKQMDSNLAIYRIVKDTAQSETLDLIGLETEGRAVAYQDNFPLKTLAMGYLGRRPTSEDIDRVFSVYDTIKARLKE